MARYSFVVLTNPVEGREDEYNDWYTNQHIGDVVGVPGMVSGQRFRLADGKSQWRYLAIYEMDTENPKAVLSELQSRAGTERMPLSEALDAKTVATMLFEPISPAETE